MLNNYDWENSFLIDFSLKNGDSENAKPTKRYLSEIKKIFNNQKSADELLISGDLLVYEFYELGAPETPGDLAFGTSITYPGKVGNEYFMTKGHFHTILDTAEVYYTLSGEGYMLMENPEGGVRLQQMTPGKEIGRAHV